MRFGSGWNSRLVSLKNQVAGHSEHRKGSMHSVEFLSFQEVFSLPSFMANGRYHLQGTVRSTI